MRYLFAVRCTLAIVFTWIISFSVSAQNGSGGSVAGSVVDDATHHPLEFVNIGLHRARDSSLVTGVVSQKKTGAFKIMNVSDGEYYLRLSIMGYKVLTTSSFTIDKNNPHPNLGVIALAEKMVSLDEVLVTGRKELQNNSIDRKIYNVDQDVMSKSGSASELLQNIPSVQVDIDGTVSLRGSSDVMILINGKNSSMMDRNRAEALQQLDASAIERIEVITNPSAKFQPDGTSGIINIVLKKNASAGLNGSVVANVGNEGRYNGGLRLNYHPGDFNFFGSYNFRHDNRNRTTLISLRQIDSTGTLTNYHEDLTSNSKPFSHLITLGFDAEAADSNFFGASANYWHNSFNAIDHAQNIYYDSNNVQTEGFDRNRNDNELQQDYGVQLFYQHKYPVKEKNLRVDYSFSGHPEEENNHFTNVFWFPPAADQFNNTFIHPLENRNQLSLDFTEPLDDRSSLDAGYAGQFNHSEYNYLITTFDTLQSALVPDEEKTSRFIYDDLINAVYATYKHSFGLFSFLAGLRAEQEHSIANMASNDSSITRNYFNFYPSLHLAYKLGDDDELQLNYTRRVHRPRLEDLNPFPDYRDPRNPISGNAGLLPEYIHSVEFGYSFQNDAITFIPSLYYRFISNRFTRVFTALDDTTLLMSQINLSNEQSGGLELVLSANLGEIISTHASANIFYDQIDATDIGYVNKSDVSWSGSLSMTIHVLQHTMVQMNMFYSGLQLTPQGENLPNYAVNMGAKQELLDNKLAVSLTVSDIFHTLKRESQVNTPLLTRTFIDTRDAGVIYLGLNYNFGITANGEKKDQLQFEE